MVVRRSVPLAVLASSAVLGLLSGVGAVVLAMGDDRVRHPTGDGAPAIEPRALRVLRAWDVRRARAYARADEAALGDLYVPGSRTGAADRAVLLGYRERGLRVAGMRTQVLAARVLKDSPRRIALLVTDTLVRAVAEHGREQRWTLPSDRASTRRVVLVNHDGTWRVVEAYAVD
jgi:hypothetical protein